MKGYLANLKMHYPQHAQRNEGRTAISAQDRQFGRIIIVAFAYMAFALDWHYLSTGETVGVWMFGTKPVLMISVLMLVFFFDQHFRCGWPKESLSHAENITLRRYVSLVFTFFLIVLLGRFFRSQQEKSFELNSYWALFEMPLWALLGYVYVNNQVKAECLFGRISAIIAFGSVVSFLFRITFGNEEVNRLLGPAGWPMRFFFMFSFFWYFVKLISGKMDKNIILGLFSSSLETIVTLHKPFIVCCVFAIPIMYALIARRQKWPFRLVIRMVSYTVCTIVVIFVINMITHGKIIKFMKHEIYVKYLKTDEDYVVRWNPEDKYFYLSGGRFSLWNEALKRFYDNPMLGSGLGQSLDSGAGLISMHNGYLDMILSFGILGCIPVLMALFRWLKIVGRSALSTKSDALYSIIFIGYMTGILVYNLVGTSRLFIPSSFFILFVFGAALRLAINSCNNSNIQPRKALINRNDIYSSKS